MGQPRITMAAAISKPHETFILTEDRASLERILAALGFDQIPGSDRGILFSPDPVYRNPRLHLFPNQNQNLTHGKLSIEYPIESELRKKYDSLMAAMEESGFRIIPY